MSATMLVKDKRTGAEEPDGAPWKDEDRSEARRAVRPTVVYRDPNDVRTILQLVSAAIILIVLLLMSAVGNLFMYMRRPDRIVIDKSNGRVVMINDREYGETEAVQMGPDRLTDSDKKYAVGEFVKALYKIDPATRAGDLERALRMMVPGSAAKFSAYLRDQHILEKQRDQSWQTVWSPQSIEVEGTNKYLVRVIGKQEITRLEGSQSVEETKQLQLTVKIVADPRGRADANLRSGFIIASIEYKELN